MIDINVNLDVFGQGLTVKSIGRVCIANRGAVGPNTTYQVWMFVDGNTNRGPKEFNKHADLKFTVTHRRPEGVWRLLDHVFSAPEFTEWARRNQE